MSPLSSQIFGLWKDGSHLLMILENLEFGYKEQNGIDIILPASLVRTCLKGLSTLELLSRLTTRLQLQKL